MSTNLPNFDKAEYVSETPHVAETQPPAGDTIPAPRPMFSSIPDGPFASWDVDATAPVEGEGRLVKAIAYGIPAMLAGSLAYAAFAIVTHIEIGFLALFLGIFIAKAMMAGSNNVGGQAYQISAAVLTYFCVSLAAIPEILWAIHSHGKDIGHINLYGIFILLKYGVASPFLELASSPFNGIIGLIIIYAGIRGAWRVTAGKRS